MDKTEIRKILKNKIKEAKETILEYKVLENVESVGKTFTLEEY